MVRTLEPDSERDPARAGRGSGGRNMTGAWERTADSPPGNRGLRRASTAMEKEESGDTDSTRRFGAAFMSLRSVMILLALIVAMTFVLIYYIRLQSDMKRTSQEIAELEQQLTEIRAENDAAYNEINDGISLEKVREKAIHELGMKYANREQVIIYSGSESDTVQQVTETDGRYTD